MMLHEYEFIKHFEGTSLKTFLININQRLYHWHSDIELLLIIEGSVVVDTAQKQYELKKNDLFLINSNEIHSLTRTKETNTILAVQFDPKFCKAYYPRLQRVKFLEKQIRMDDKPVVWGIIRQYLTNIVMDYFAKENGYQLKLMSTMNAMVFYLLCNIMYEEIEEGRIFTEEKNLARLNRIVNHIQGNYMNKISLRDIAANEGLDMYYLSHFIRKQLGISFQEYLNKVRLEKAVHMITHTNSRNIDICMECGFSDYRYLNNMFLKEYGCTPAQYKAEYSKLNSALFSLGSVSETGFGTDGQHHVMNEEEALEKLIRYIKQ